MNREQHHPSSIHETIQKHIQENEVVLYMKGTPKFPMCGFSGAAVKILNTLQTSFVAFNVLDNLELREGIKIFSDWPMIPQLYIRGEFIGGSDIMKEMLANGELERLLKQPE